MCDVKIDREFKLRLMERLKREGRWDKAQQFKEDLRLSGEDNSTAWEYMAEEFPPATDDDSGQETLWPELSPAEESELEELIRRHNESGAKSDVSDDLQWTYKNMEDGMTPKDCPTPGVWNWICLARANPTKFLLMALDNNKKRRERGDNGWQTDDWRIIKLIDEIRESLEDED